MKKTMKHIKKYFKKDPCEEEQLRQVKDKGFNIRDYKNPSLRVQWEAVYANSSNLVYIKNPHKVIQMLAVSKGRGSLRFTKNPDPEVIELNRQASILDQKRYDIEEEIRDLVCPWELRRALEKEGKWR